MQGDSLELQNKTISKTKMNMETVMGILDGKEQLNDE
jgi:hypothetical protein